MEWIHEIEIGVFVDMLITQMHDLGVLFICNIFGR